DINTVVNNAVQLRALDLRSGTSRVELQLESVLPGVRGDGNQLMQVFFNIISNALEAMEAASGGVLTIKTIRDRGNVVILFSDSGPGLKDPHRVFDPFYTTKPVGKGTGLGLSICFGIVQEHGGKILCYNRQEGGEGVTMPEMAIRTEKLTRRFGNLTAVDGVDLQVTAGQFFGFLGPNGAGKSTTIKILTGLLAPTSGNIELLGVDFAANPVEVKRQIGVVPEGMGLFERLTGSEY